VNESFDPAINLIVPPLFKFITSCQPATFLERFVYRPENEQLSELLAMCEQESLTISEEQAGIIEAAIHEQSKNTAWFTQWAGRITASLILWFVQQIQKIPHRLIHRI